MNISKHIIAAAAIAALMPLSASAIYVEGETTPVDDGMMHIMTDTAEVTTQSEFTAQDVCEEVGGEFIVHMVVTPLGGGACLLGDYEISLDSLEDKYHTYVQGAMIHYASEWKYSDKAIWDDYLEFAQHDIDDTKAFREMDISDEAKERIDEKLPVMENLYEFMRLEASLGARNIKILSNALDAYEAKFSETRLPSVREKLEAKLEKAIADIEYQMMVSHYTPEGYVRVVTKLDGYKYLLMLVRGRM